jgi:hypothetical protein
MLCFDPFEPRKFKSHIKTNAEVNATGVVYTPGVCRGQTMPSRTLFGVHYIHDRRGYSDSVRSIGKAVVGRNGERQMRIPRFLYVRDPY